MAAWFLVMALMGLRATIATPVILSALNPYYALAFFATKPVAAFLSLGSVVLAVTGCEALYADMGHFGREPIRYAWLYVSFPALVLVYLGQAATVMHNPGTTAYVFYAMA